MSRPFWLVNVFEIEVFMAEIVFGNVFSSHTRSMRLEAELRLVDRSFLGISRWVIGGK